MRIYDPRNEHGDELLTKKDANSSFPTKTEVADAYLSQNDASSTYLSKSSASSTYATKTSLNDKADKSEMDLKADKSQLEAKADKTALDTKADKTELETKVSTDQVVSTTIRLNKNLVNNTLTITTSDVPDITNWAIYQMEAVLSSGQKFQIMSDYTKGSDSITMVIGDGRSLDFSNVIVNLIRESSSGVQAAETLEVLVSLIDATIASGDKEAIQTLGAKLAATGAEEYTLAGAKTGNEASSLMTGQNMGAFENHIATLDGNHLVLNDTQFAYNMMSLENNVVEYNCGMFVGSNITTFTSELPSLTNAYGMFFGCSKLTSFTSNLPSLTDGQHMFSGCNGLTSFTSDLRSLTYGHSMFDGCTSLTYVEPKNCKNSTALNQIISSLPTYDKADGSHMILFSTGNEELNEELTINALMKGWGVGTDATDAYYYYGSKNMKEMMYTLVDGSHMFSYDESLTEWHYDMPNLTNGESMFNCCYNLTSFTSDLPSLTNGSCMFDGCSKLTSFTSDLPALTDGRTMFYSCKLDTPSIQRIANSLPTYTDGTHKMYITSGATTVKQEELDAHKLIESKGWNNTLNLRNVVGEVKDVDFSGITNAQSMFYNCTGLTSWTVSIPESLTNASSMFYGCTGLTSWNGTLPDSLSNVQNMFSGCSGLTSWNVALPESLTSGQYMFQHCSGLTSWNGTLPESLTDCQYMFDDCSGLTSWNVALPQSLSNAFCMFSICTGLTEWTVALPKSLINATEMFYGCTNLTSFTPWGKNEDGTLKDTGTTGNITKGYQMFHKCKLDLASVKRIADWLPQRSSSKPTGTESFDGWIHIGVASGVNSGTDFNTAISTMTSKNWGVVICVNGSETRV